VSALISTRAGGALGLAVRVKPRASVSRVLGVRGDVLEVAVAAPPVDGAANVELVATLAKWLGVPRTGLTVITGATGRQKVVAITGLTEADLRARCSA